MKVYVRVVNALYVKLLEIGKSEPARHLADNKSHMFTLKVLTSSPLHFCKRKILEVIFITKLKLDLNDQVEHHALSLFQHGVP